MVHVAILGAAGGIGQPASLLLKMNPQVSKLTLYDIVNTPGVAADISHIDTPARVNGYLPPDDGLKNALTGAEVVIIPAGVPRKPGMTRDDLFKINAGIVRDLATAIANYCPDAFILVISNPVNSTVPIVAEVLKKHQVYKPKRLFGITTLDIVRASTFLAEASGEPTHGPKISCPVLGGHSGITIIPLLSQSDPAYVKKLDQQGIEALTKRIQFGGDEVVNAKRGSGSATLSMAYAAAEFANKVIHNIAVPTSSFTTQAYVPLEADPEGAKLVTDTCGTPVDYFSANVKIGSNGLDQILPVGDISEYEQELLKRALPELQENIKKGVSFITTPKL